MEGPEVYFESQGKLKSHHVAMNSNFLNVLESLNKPLPSLPNKCSANCVEQKRQRGLRVTSWMEFACTTKVLSSFCCCYLIRFSFSSTKQIQQIFVVYFERTKQKAAATRCVHISLNARWSTKRNCSFYISLCTQSTSSDAVAFCAHMYLRFALVFFL